MRSEAGQYVTLVEVLEVIVPFEEFAQAVGVARRLEAEGVRELVAVHFARPQDGRGAAPGTAKGGDPRNERSLAGSWRHTSRVEEIMTVAEAQRGGVMTEVELTRDALIVHVQGMDRLWALKSRLEIPLSHVLDAEVDPQVAREWRKGLRAPGTHVPGVLTAGTFFQDGDRVFWDVRDPEKTIVIRLEDERYARLVIEVDDPSATAAAIEEAIG